MSANVGERRAGGGSGIRTHDTVSRIHAFQACALSHSAIPPVQGGEYSHARWGDNPAAHVPAKWVPVRRQEHAPLNDCSVGPAHLARLAHVIAGKLGGALTERRRA